MFMGKRYSYLVYSAAKALMCVTLSEKAAQNIKNARYYIKQLENAPFVWPFDGKSISSTSIPFEVITIGEKNVWRKYESVDVIDTIQTLLDEKTCKSLGIDSVMVTGDMIVVTTVDDGKLVQLNNWLGEMVPTINDKVDIVVEPVHKKGCRRQPRGKAYREKMAKKL